MHALKKRKKRNIKRPDSPDIDREGGKPTKMGNINNASALYKSTCIIV